MKARKLLVLGITAALGACSSDMATSPTGVTSTPGPTSPTAYSIQAFVSQGQIANRSGIKSPASVDIAFRTTAGQLMDIVSATLVLKDDAGIELTRQEYGPTAGILAFRPAWSGEAIGRKVDITLQARVAGQISSTQFTLPL